MEGFTGGLNRGENMGLACVTRNFFSCQIPPIAKSFLLGCRPGLSVGKSPSCPSQEQPLILKVPSLSHPGRTSTPLAPAEELRPTTSDFSLSVPHLPGEIWAQIPVFQGTNYSRQFPWLEIPPPAAPRCPEINK